MRTMDPRKKIDRGSPAFGTSVTSQSDYLFFRCFACANVALYRIFAKV
jgi:hypothetical protein